MCSRHCVCAMRCVFMVLANLAFWCVGAECTVHINQWMKNENFLEGQKYDNIILDYLIGGNGECCLCHCVWTVTLSRGQRLRAFPESWTKAESFS